MKLYKGFDEDLKCRVFAEYGQKGGERYLKHCKVFMVDGEKVKADTYYTLKNGRLVEVKA